MHLLHIIMISLFSTFTVTDGFLFGPEPSDEKSISRCLSSGEGEIKIECEMNEKISILRLDYGAEPPEGDCNAPSDRNGCLQYSQTLTDQARERCDDKSFCTVDKTPIANVPNREAIPEQNTCGIGGSFYETIKVNFIQIKYKCRAFTFCKKTDDVVSQLTVQTSNFPSTSLTNPTCGCSFETNNRFTTYMNAMVQCNGTVQLTTEELLYQDGKSITMYESYLCINKLDRNALVLGEENSPVRIKVNVDKSNSSEQSSFSITILSFRVTEHILLPDSKVKVQCVEGALVFSSIVQGILYIGVPVTLVLLIALVVIYCVMNKRRKKQREWRRRNIKLPGESLNGNGLIMREMDQEHDDPEGSSSLPSSTRHKPEGKIDSESEDDLAEIATLLHTRNKQRRVAELTQRHMYQDEMPWLTDNTDALPGNTEATETRYFYTYTRQQQDREVEQVTIEAAKYIIYQSGTQNISLSDHAVDRMAIRGYVDPDKAQPDMKNRRSQSAANIHSTVGVSSALKNSRSVSNSRSSVRSHKRRAPPPPTKPGHMIPNGQAGSPDSLPEPLSPPPCYASVDETPIVRPHITNNNDSPYATPDLVNGTPITVYRTPPRSLSSTSNSSKKGKRDKKKKKREKPKYFNPYHVEKPKHIKPVKTTSSQDTTDDRGDRSKPSSDPFSSMKQRRYSQDSHESHKASDHEFSDLEQIDVLGMDDDELDDF